MKTIKVLGSGCKNCVNTADLIRQKADELGVEVEVVKVTDMGEIMGYGVMSTPGVVIDEKVVHAGSVPGMEQIAKWLREAGDGDGESTGGNGGCCCGGGSSSSPDESC